MRKKEVRIISVDRRYRKEPYPICPTYRDSIGNYITGQHIDPGKPETRGFLTRDQIKGEKPLTMEQAKMFPHIIRGEHWYPLLHMRKFDLSETNDGIPVNPKDYAEFNLFKLQYIIASSKKKVIKGTHYFYIEDVEGEALDMIAERDIKWKAEKFVRENTSIGSYKNIALLLNYKIETLRINVNSLTETMLQARLLECIDKYPREVYECSHPSSKDDLFYLKLEHFDVISRKGRSFFDGSTYLGDTIEDIKKFSRSKEGSSLMNRWGRVLAERESGVKPVVSENKSEYQTYITDCSLAIIQKNLKTAISNYDDAIRINPKGNELPSLYQAIEDMRVYNANQEVIVLDQQLMDDERIVAELDVEETIESYNRTLSSKSLEELQTICRLIKGNKKKGWEEMDKDTLTEYLVSKKFNV